MNLGVIRVITTDDQEVLNAHGKILAEELGVNVTSRCVPEQPDGVHDAATFRDASAKTVELSQQMVADEDLDAILISCAADPGVPETTLRLDIPVIGAGSAAAAHARTLGERVGVLDLTPETPRAVIDVLGEAYVGALVPAGVRTSADLQLPESRNAAVDAAKQLARNGAEVVMFACTGMTTINLAAILREELDVPIVDAVRSGGRAALSAAGQK